MRRVPEWLPEVLAWHNWRNRSRMDGAFCPGHDIFKIPVPSATRMDLIVYESPSMISGLLMTEALLEENWYGQNEIWGNRTKKHRVVKSFFGYRCGGCRDVFLVHKDARRIEDLDRDLVHECDPSDFRRAVRNARDMARERGEYIMEGLNGEFHPVRYPDDV